MEDVEDSSEVLDAVPTKFYALIALMIHESWVHGYVPLIRARPVLIYSREQWQESKRTGKECQERA